MPKIVEVEGSNIRKTEDTQLPNVSKNQSIITITDHRNDHILEDITEDMYWDDEHFKSLENKQETFNFVTFADEDYSEYLAKRNRVIIPDEDGKFVEFIITNTLKYHGSEGLNIEVYTSATYVTLKKAKVINPFSTDTISAEAHALSALSDTEWEVGTVDFVGNRSISFTEHTNPYAYLKRIASMFDLELHFRVETDGNRVTRRYVDLVEHIGEWQGKEVTFGKDLENIERKEDTSNVVTALVGLGPEREDGTREEVFVEDEEALQRWGRMYDGELMHIIAPYEPETTDQDMSESRLRTLTENELEKRVNESVEYKANVIDLEKVIGLEHEQLRFGDIIKIKDLKFNPPIFLEARVHTQSRSIKRDGSKEVTLGDYTEYTEEEVNSIWRRLQRELKSKIDFSDLQEVTYTKEVIDQKDERGNQSADKIEQDIGWEEVIESEQGAQDKADNAEDNANRYTDEHAVAQELYDQTIADINENLSGKAELEYVNGQLQLKADSEIVQAIDNIVDDLQGVTDGLLQDVADHADELSDQGGRITTVETDLDTVEGNLSVAINDLSTLDGVVEEQGTQISANSEAISLKADQTTLEGLQDDFNNLEIGGRNLLGGTGFNEIPESRSSSLTIIEGNPNSLFVENTSNTPTGFITDRITEIKKGQVYTLSIEVKTDNTKTLDYNYIMHYEEGNWSGVPSIDLIQDGEWHEYTVTFTSTVNRTNAGLLIAADYRDNPGESYEVRKLMMVEGNKIGSWQPAPEDIEADISAIDGKVETVSGNLSVLAGEVELKAERSELETVEGNVSTLSNEVSSLSVAYDGIEATVSSLETTVGDHGTDITNLNTDIQAVAGEVSSKVSAEYVSGAIADIEVGGRNLLRNSTFNDDYDYWSLHSSYSTIVPPEEDKPNSNILHMHHENYNGNSPRPSETPFPKIKVGDVITFSLDIFAENISDISVTILTFRHATSPNGSHNGDIYSFNRSNLPNDFIEGEWNRVSGTFEIEDVTDGEYLYIALYTSRGYFNFKVREIQVEKGNKATDWTPAPEDTNAEIESVYEYAESNISQLSGRIDAKAESTVVDDIEGRVSSAETSIDGLEGAITSKVEVTTFNTLEGRVDEAESTISQHANQIQSKVEENDVRSIFTQEADSFTFDADQINFDGHVFGENATFEGDIVGGRILSNSSIDVTTDLYVGNNIYLGDSSFEVKTIHFNDYASISNTGTTSDDITVTGNSLQFGYQSAYYGGIQLTIDGSYNSSPTINFDTNNNQYDSSIVLDRLSGDLQFHGDEFDFKGNVTASQYYSNTGYFKYNDSNSIQITSSNIRLISGGELKQAFGSIPKVRLDPSGDGIVDDKTFGANNPASMQPVLTDYIVVDLKGKTEIILNTDFLNFVSDYYVFASKDVDIIEQKEGSILVDGNGKHMIQVVGIQKGKEDVVGYRIVNEEEKVQTMGLLSTAPTENNPINRTFKPKIRGEEAKGNETRRK